MVYKSNSSCGSVVGVVKDSVANRVISKIVNNGNTAVVLSNFSWFLKMDDFFISVYGFLLLFLNVHFSYLSDSFFYFEFRVFLISSSLVLLKCVSVYILLA